MYETKSQGCLPGPQATARYFSAPMQPCQQHKRHLSQREGSVSKGFRSARIMHGSMSWEAATRPKGDGSSQGCTETEFHVKKLRLAGIKGGPPGLP
jgi:hypothetical protein